MRNKDFIYITHEQVIDMHKCLINKFGGSHGIRDKNRLESILGSIKQTFDGELLFKTCEEVAGAYLYYFITGHPFVDGNKRIGVFVALEFLAFNKYPKKKELPLLNEMLTKLGFEVAQGKLNREETVAQFKEMLT